MDDDEASPNGALYRFDGRRLHRCDDDYVITNGPATSPDGRTLYHIDTLKRVIYAFDLAADGSLSKRRVFARLAETDGYPDGPVVDATGCIWVGLFGGWGVNRYSPHGRAAEQAFVAGRKLHQGRCSAATICKRCTSRARGKVSLPSSARSSRLQADCSPREWIRRVCRQTWSLTSAERRWPRSSGAPAG